MNLLDCETDPGPLIREHALLAWRVHRYCERTACRVRQRARTALQEFACRSAGIEVDLP
ncbi:hypothetical protein LTV02_21810 [Nocardia yamanashiensis]|uniref:hypothetical protein n=1 Tax=Nocardia yamanashiensis TaxID=209247 RepID=UPI001E5C1DE8|nr:hypothetical protein [Nocardia yamanashiensis]UGT38757.1 hypothetical protein LTV02_21810 [Nocardia yamanashiensis]